MLTARSEAQSEREQGLQEEPAAESWKPVQVQGLVPEQELQA